MSTFIAIDFETATIRRDSACAVGFAAGYGGRVVLSRTYLIRPPSAQFTFTGLHGLRWEDVHDAPTFAGLWPTLRGWIDHAAFVAAHNASFDRGRPASTAAACEPMAGIASQHASLADVGRPRRSRSRAPGWFLRLHYYS